jgi:hypothetical protein
MPFSPCHGEKVAEGRMRDGGEDWSATIHRPKE